MTDRTPLALGYLLVPIDFSDRSLQALAYARGLAARFGATVELLHVVEPSTVEGFVGSANPAVWLEALEGARRKLQELAQGDPFKVVEGRPADLIVDHAQAVKADLIVVGSLGRTGLERLLVGSVAERVVRLAPCPVLVVREGAAAKS